VAVSANLVATALSFLATYRLCPMKPPTTFPTMPAALRSTWALGSIFGHVPHPTKRLLHPFVPIDSCLQPVAARPTSPRLFDTSPQCEDASPRQGIAGPQGGHARPQWGTPSPQEENASPQRGSASPHSFFACPERENANHHSSAASPQGGHAITQLLADHPPLSIAKEKRS
jgi:hypothetical protein